MLGDDVQQGHRARPGDCQYEQPGGLVGRVPAGEQREADDARHQGHPGGVDRQRAEVVAEHAQGRVEHEEDDHPVLARVDLGNGLRLGDQPDQGIQLLVEPGGHAIAEGGEEQAPHRQRGQQDQNPEPGRALGAARGMCRRRAG